LLKDDLVAASQQVKIPVVAEAGRECRADASARKELRCLVQSTVRSRASVIS
jgi:hypothetical protein